MKNNYVNIGKILKREREKNGISQRELAKRINVSNAEISKIESGERKLPSLDTLISICEKLKIDMVWLLKITGLYREEGIKTFYIKATTLKKNNFKVSAKDEEEAMDLIADYIFSYDDLDDNEDMEIELEVVETEEENDNNLSEKSDDNICESCDFYCPCCGCCILDD